MPNPMPAKVIEQAHGFTEVDGIPVQVGQGHREGFFQLIDTIDGGPRAHYCPSLNGSDDPYSQMLGTYEPWPAIPQNTLNRR